jgi:predicted ABC-type sugar transport system permease subunit
VLITQGTLRRHPRTTQILKILTGAWSWLFLLFILIFFEAWARISFGSTLLGRVYSVQSILLAATQILMLALGLTFVIIAAGIDLSVGFIAGLSAVTMAVVIRSLTPHTSEALAFAAGLTAGCLIPIVPGLINGWLVARLKVPSFIGTLGMFGITRGAAFLIAGGATVALRNTYAREFGNGRIFGDLVPIPVFLAIVLTVLAHYLLTHTKFGLYTYAMGGNMNAAIRAGVNVTRQTVVIFILSAVSAGIAGLIYTGRFSAGAADAGEPLLLYAVAAIFIGGASLTGGTGTIIGTVIGSLIIAVIQFGLVFIDVPPYWQFVAVGIVIIIAVLIDQSRDRLTKAAQDS